MQKAFALSDQQVDDGLYLRRLFLTRRGQLTMQRDALISELRHSQAKQLHPEESLSSVTELASKLRKNAAEDYLTSMKMGFAARRGVSVGCRSLFSINTVKHKSSMKHMTWHKPSRVCRPRPVVHLMLLHAWLSANDHAQGEVHLSIVML